MSHLISYGKFFLEEVRQGDFQQAVHRLPELEKLKAKAPKGEIELWDQLCRQAHRNRLSLLKTFLRASPLLIRQKNSA